MAWNFHKENSDLIITPYSVRFVEPFQRILLQLRDVKRCLGEFRKIRPLMWTPLVFDVPQVINFNCSLDLTNFKYSVWKLDFRNHPLGRLHTNFTITKWVCFRRKYPLVWTLLLEYHLNWKKQTKNNHI